jgi:hypothetical protein
MALSRLSEEEIAACLVAERCLGVTAEAWDVDGRVGAVDAMLHFPDGRTGAFEVTTLAGDGALQTANLLARDENTWPTSGDWCWTINVGSPRDLPRLRASYQRIILACEAAGTPFPTHIAWGAGADDDVRWLVQDSSCSMLGHPTARGDRVWAMVVPNGAGDPVHRWMKVDSFECSRRMRQGAQNRGRHAAGGAVRLYEPVRRGPRLFWR